MLSETSLLGRESSQVEQSPLRRSTRGGLSCHRVGLLLLVRARRLHWFEYGGGFVWEVAEG